MTIKSESAWKTNFVKRSAHHLHRRKWPVTAGVHPPPHIPPITDLPPPRSQGQLLQSRITAITAESSPVASHFWLHCTAFSARSLEVVAGGTFSLLSQIWTQFIQGHANCHLYTNNEFENVLFDWNTKCLVTLATSKGRNTLLRVNKTKRLKQTNIGQKQTEGHEEEKWMDIWTYRGRHQILKIPTKHCPLSYLTTLRHFPRHYTAYRKQL